MIYHTDEKISLIFLFLKFLKFGFLAWGGPVAQIAMLKSELVIREKWVSVDKFNKVLAVYQALPGPEATELCVYFGMLKKGRLGGLAAGLGFFLPGFLLMLLLSWFYYTYGTSSFVFAGIFFGFQPAVVALIARAVHRLGEHILKAPILWLIALIALAAQLLNVNFIITLLFSGTAYFLYKRNKFFSFALLLIFTAYLLYAFFTYIPGPVITQTNNDVRSVSILELLYYGLRTGLLTFGGAYTAIPFLQNDAVIFGKWMTNAEFLDGIALSGILPAPLIIFSTFVGYAGGGIPGAVIMTFGVFLPAFAITLFGHSYLEKTVENKSIHSFLEGITAGVIGLITGTSLTIALAALTNPFAIIVFAAALAGLYLLKTNLATLYIIAAAGALGILFKIIYG